MIFSIIGYFHFSNILSEIRGDKGHQQGTMLKQYKSKQAITKHKKHNRYIQEVFVATMMKIFENFKKKI